ncbi:MAG: exodeoxyribonuclease V subunit gamma [Acidobacteriota bacterium]|nr:exodeoxyribonuclease V subunit gamma [Acidobacteriota bacterium]
MPNATGKQLSLLMDQPDAAFRVHASHRLETLARRLAEEMSRHPAEPLEPERIVVPDALLGQWLRLQLASHLGVAAHLRVEQPAQFAWAAMREEVAELTGESVYGPPHLRWRIFERLKNWTGDDEIARYLEDGDSRKRFELADQLAVAYDRCRVYRPDAIRAWQQGQGSGWHARLWRELAPAAPGAEHWVDAIDRYRDRLEQRPRAAGTRQRVSFFHPAALSPTYVEVLRLAARVMDVHLYLLSPSHDFWSRPAGAGEVESNELLDAWGRSARDLRALIGSEPDRVVVVDHPRSGDMPADAGTGRAGGTAEDLADVAARPTCLASVQRRILEDDPEAPVATGARTGSDDSIQIHVCHSPTREVEVLHDRLLGLFDTYSDIQPADVLVLTPDLDTYAPLVEAVFGSAGRVGVSIGRRRLKEGAALAAFLDLLELPGSRYAANDVLAPLLAESVRLQFGITDTGLATIRGAVAMARIRWGRDGEHRTELDVPASPNHNWRRGLDRLLLGYAMQEGETLVDGIAPSALDHWGQHTGAADYELLGRFRRYCDLAFALNDWTDAEHDATAWMERLQAEVLDAFFTSDHRAGPEAVREVNTVSRLLSEFDEECKRAGAAGAIPFPVLRDVLNDMAEKAARSAPRLDDGIAVADLASGQVFPARVICAVGMNDGAFPRRPRPPQFDFQADLFEGEARQPGDRDRRNEDRLAFLEALLAARRHFVLTYTGRDLQEDKPIPPSAVASELAEYLEQIFPDPGGKNDDEERDRWATRHPLQPFSPKYFEPGETALFSYSESMRNAAEALRASGDEPDRFAGELAAEPREETVELELEDLVRFAASPSQDFLRKRLDILLDVREDDVAADEPLDLNALESWQLKSDLAGIGEQGDERTIELAAARGLLPPRNLGLVQHRQSAAQVAALMEKLQPFQRHREAPRHRVEVEFGNVRLVGAVGQFDEGTNQLLFWRIGSLRPKDRIGVWLRLLALVAGRQQPATAHLLGSKDQVEHVALRGPERDEARSLLGDWVEVWRESQRRPLPFFASTSWVWTEKRAWSRKVQDEWSKQPWFEGNDPRHRLIFGDDPSGDDFERLAERLLRPLREASA